MNIIISLFITFSLTLCNYNQFNQSFIDVSKNQSPSIVSIISEKTEKAEASRANRARINAKVRVLDI